MNELAQLVNDYIKSKGVTKSFIAEQLGMSQQLLRTLFMKKNFTIDDANKILKVIDCKVTYEIKPFSVVDLK